MSLLKAQWLALQQMSIRAIIYGHNYGQGFYTFAKRRDALKWQHLRPKLLDIQEEHVTLEFRIPRDVWRRFRRKQVPEFYNWRIPQDWIREFDILESPWGITPETRSLKNAKQYKFNPNTYEMLDASLVR